MKIKNKLLFFLGIFIFMIIPKNVYANEIYPFTVMLNDTNFTSTWRGSFNNRLAPSITHGNGTYTLNIQVESFNANSVQSGDYDDSFLVYPYTLIYFQTWNTPNEIGISKSTACTQSCFGRDNVTLKQIGKDADSGRYRYVLILENKKWRYFEGSLGGSETIYRIDDVITFTNKHASTDRAFIFYQVLLTDDTNILNNNSLDIDSMLTNATNNMNYLRDSINNMSNAVTNSINSSTNAIQGKIDTTNQNLNNLNNTMSSEEAPTNSDVSNKTNEWASKLAGTGPVSQMVLMPITLLNGYVSGLNTTCQPYNLGSLMGTDIILPCINISNYVGVSLWNVIDILFSGFMIFAIGKKFVKIFNDFTNLRDNQMDELYGGGK